MKAKAQKLRAPDFEGDDQETSGAAEVKPEGCKVGTLQRRLYWTQLQILLSTDPVLTMLNPELIGPIRGPAIAPRAAKNTIKAV